MKKTLLLFLLLPLFGLAQNVELIKWNAATAGTPKRPVANGSVTTSDLTSPSSIPVTYNTTDAANPFFSAGGWPTPQQNEAEYDPEKYVEFKVTPVSGKKLDLNTFNFAYRSQGGTTERFKILYSKDNTFTNDVKVLVPETISSTNWTTITPSFSEEINPVLPGQIVYVRLYVYTSNNNFHFKTGTSTSNYPTVITGSVSDFDPNRILAINDYVKAIRNTALNIAPLNNDIRKENVTSVTISSAPPASQGTVTVNPDRTITFNPANNYTGVSSFNYTIRDAANNTSEAKVQVTIANETPESLVIWYGRNTSNRNQATALSPYVTGSDILRTPSNSPVAYNNTEDSSNPFFIVPGTPYSATVNNNRYVEFRVTADNSHRVNLNAFNFSFRNQADNGEQQKFKIDYSKDPAFASNVKSLLAETISNSNSWRSISASFNSDYLSAGETIYIRLYVYNTYNNFQFRTKLNITGVVKDAQIFAAYSDFATTPSNQTIPINILSNDVVGTTPVQSITVTQPTTGGSVAVNGVNNVTFTPTSGFVGTSNFTYTIFNGTVYSSATVSVDVTAPPCTVPGDQVAFATNTWIGYVYKWTGNTPPNPATPTTLPISSTATYIGTVTENRLFDRNVGTGAVSGLTTNIPCEAAPTDKFFVRYKMSTTIAEAGQYNFMLGSDDGIRLYIDGVLIMTRWNDHSYIVDSALRNLTAGSHDFILEYYENDGSSRTAFSFGLVKGDQTLPYGDKVWNVYGFVKNDLNLANVVYAGNYVDPNLNVNSRTYWAVDKSPSAATIWQGAPMPDDNFTTSFRRRGFPCGQYQIQLVNSDDATQIYIDDVLVFTQSGYTNTAVIINNPTTYALNSNSRVEIRLREDGGNANVAVNFIRVPTTYNGTGTPAANSAIIINSNTTLSSDLTVCSCTVSPNYTLTVPNGVTLTVDEDINVGTGGKLLVQSGGSLMQTSTSKTMFSGNTTAFEIQRTTSVRLFDLTYWSLPVTKTGFSMYDLSPNTLWDKYIYFDSNANNWAIDYYGKTPMIIGKGYSIRAPQGTDVNTASNFTAIFTGTPNNGDIPTAVVAGKWNLIGNPYPSAINADKLMTDNALGSLYFWSHKALPVYNTTDGQFYYNSDFTAYNKTGGTSTGGSAPFNGYIAVGQGFIAKPTTATVNYNNDQRRKGNNSQFFKTGETQELEKNRVWLNFSNNDGLFKQILLGYIEGATNSLDNDFDAVSMGANALIDFYSINSNKKMMIQGRALPFEKSDEVPLGYKLASKGDYTISIDHADGFFNNQDVFLEDKETGKITNLRLEDYSFTTTEGSFNDRFVLRYTSKTLGTDDFENSENSVLVSVKSKVIKVNSTSENIKEIQIYNIGGQTLYTKNKIDATELQITNLQSSNQVLLAKIILENGAIVTKKIIFN